MNYKRTQSKNARLRSENWTWFKIVSFTIFMLFASLFGPELLKLLK